jgi:hypothetical protein
MGAVKGYKNACPHWAGDAAKKNIITKLLDKSFSIFLKLLKIVKMSNTLAEH